ncbi:MAG: HPr family phosphocarrier protein [Deltaproteobacteria bacterium]|nr:HPr family phosphocarrier protein [Deltaproteobacteria bacterium]
MEQKYTEATISYEAGIHARPASQIAEIAKKADSAIYIQKDNIIADASSVTDILMLFCPQGSKIKVFADNPADKIIVDEIIKLIKSDFSEKI